MHSPAFGTMLLPPDMLDRILRDFLTTPPVVLFPARFLGRMWVAAQMAQTCRQLASTMRHAGGDRHGRLYNLLRILHDLHIPSFRVDTVSWSMRLYCRTLTIVVRRSANWRLFDVDGFGRSRTVIKAHPNGVFRAMQVFWHSDETPSHVDWAEFSGSVGLVYEDFHGHCANMVFRGQHGRRESGVTEIVGTDIGTWRAWEIA